MIQFSPTGQPLNMHAQMAHSPAVLEAYVSLRRASAHLGTLDQRIRSALMLTSATAAANDYAVAVLSMLALRSGWRQDEVEAIRVGKDLGDAAADGLGAGGGGGLDRRAARRGVRFPRAGRFHRLLPQLRGHRTGPPGGAVRRGT